MVSFSSWNYRVYFSTKRTSNARHPLYCRWYRYLLLDLESWTWYEPDRCRHLPPSNVTRADMTRKGAILPTNWYMKPPNGYPTESFRFNIETSANTNNIQGVYYYITNFSLFLKDFKYIYLILARVITSSNK